MITITAATGRYGRLVIESLLRRGVPPSNIVAAVRNPEKATDLVAKGIQVREADYDRPETLVPAFTGAKKLLLIPSASIKERFVQMAEAVNAAVAVGVDLVGYAGFINGDTSTLRLGFEHKQTEAYLRASGLPFIFLRNGAYIDVYAGDLGNIGHALATGVLLGSAGAGKISGASREDLADAAAITLMSESLTAALMSKSLDGAVFELGGKTFTMYDIAESISQLTGKPLVYQDLPVEQYCQTLAEAGLPMFLADVIADTSHAIQRGDWYTESNDLERILGRPARPLIEVVEAALNRNGLL